MRKEVRNKPVHGYKVFNPDWTCSPEDWDCSPEDNTKQYSCPGKFEEKGPISLCKHGMHFCQKLVNCFSYYKFNPNNKVAEVIASGDVIIEDLNDLCCTNKLEIVRELSWEEVLRLVNIGNNCTGVGNVGHHNSGDYNVGDSNSGTCNVGNSNTGKCNTGDTNFGQYNSGNRNTGDCNTGNENSGNWNVGNNNIGDGNTGSNNIGNNNVGDWNKSSLNVGCFNTEEQKITFFNKPSDWTYRMWFESRARSLLNQISIIRWSYLWEMTDEEKNECTESEAAEVAGGYLTKAFSDNQEWWNELSDKDKKIIKDLPNFDPDVFFECTGIKVE
jgi:hypothetical protein